MLPGGSMAGASPTIVSPAASHSLRCSTSRRSGSFLGLNFLRLAGQKRICLLPDLEAEVAEYWANACPWRAGSLATRGSG